MRFYTPYSSLLTLSHLVDMMDSRDSLYASYGEAYNTLKSHSMQHGYSFVLNRRISRHDIITTAIDSKLSLKSSTASVGIDNSTIN